MNILLLHISHIAAKGLRQRATIQEEITRQVSKFQASCKSVEKSRLYTKSASFSKITNHFFYQGCAYLASPRSAH